MVVASETRTPLFWLFEETKTIFFFHWMIQSSSVTLMTWPKAIVFHIYQVWIKVLSRLQLFTLMSRVLQKSLLFLKPVTLSHLLMNALEWFGCLWLPIKVMSIKHFRNFIIWLAPNTKHRYVFYSLTMVQNMSMHFLTNFWGILVFVIIPLAPILHSKMDWQKEKIDNCWKWFVPLFLAWICLGFIGERLWNLLLISLIVPFLAL